MANLGQKQPNTPHFSSLRPCPPVRRRAVRHGRLSPFRRAVTLELLEDRRLLDSDLTSALQSVLKSNALPAEQLIDAVHDRVFDNLLPGTLPVIRDALKVKDGADDQLKFLSTKVRDAIVALSGLTEVTSEQVRSALAGQLGTLLRSPMVVTCGAGFAVCNTASPANEIRFRLPLAGTVVEKDTAFDLGLPNLLSAEGTVHARLEFTMDLQLGFKVGEGPFLETEPLNNELAMRLVVTPSSPNLTGRLGFLRFNATEVNTPLLDLTYSGNILDSAGDSNSLLTANEIPQMRLEGTRTGQMTFNPLLTFDMGAAVFPTLTTKLSVGWRIQGAVNEPLVTLGDQPSVSFRNVTMDIGGFFTNFVHPIAQKIDNALGPLDEIVGVLTTRIPILSDISVLRSLICGSCDEVTPLTFLGVDDDSGFVAAFRAVVEFINESDGFTGTGTTSLGSFDVGGDVRTLTTLASSLTNLQEVLPSPTGPFGSFLSSISETPLSFPLLTDPERVFRIIAGDPGVEIFKLDMPTLRADRSITSPTIPILGPLGIWFEGGLEVGFDIDFGYDAYGFQLYAANNFANTNDIFEGFYVVDSTEREARLKASIKVFGGVDLALVQFGVGGGVTGEIFMDLHDPNNDGRLRPREIAQNLQMGPLCLFDFGGSLNAVLTVFAKFGIGPFSIEFSYDFVEVELASFDFPCNAGNDVPWATLDPDSRELRLHTGPRGVIPSFQRDENGQVLGVGFGYDEHVHISKIGTDEATGLDILQVDAGGVKQIYAGVRSIFAEGGEGRDVIQIDANVRARATLYGGYADSPSIGTYVDGNDILVVGGGGGEIHGGPGDDDLGGGGGLGYDNAPGTITIYGDEGNDILHGGRWADLLFGGAGDDRIFGNLGDDILTGGDGQDLIFGSDGNDLIFGNGGDDDLRGEAGHDEIHGGDPDVFGLGGNDILRGGEGNNRLYGDGGNDILYALSGRDQLYGGDGDDFINSEAGDDEVHGGAGNDEIFAGDGQNFVYGDDGDDRLFGGIDHDEIHGGRGNDTVNGAEGSDFLFGEEGNDWVAGHDGADIIRGGEGDDTLFGLAGADTIYGDDGADTIYGGTENDALDGGSHDDRIAGDEGDDSITGDGNLDGVEGDDTLYGGIGNDFILGRGGNDRIYGEEGNDQLVGNSGNDTIYAGVGHDIVLGDDGQFVQSTYEPTGGNGSDLLYGDDGDDLLFGQGGNDTINGGRGADKMFAGVDNDDLHGGPGDDLLFGQDGNDGLLGEDGLDLLDGGQGLDVLQGGLGADRLYGGDGADFLFGHTIDPGDDHAADILYGGAGPDVMTGQGGNDFLDGGADADAINGGSGDDTLQAGGGIGDQLFGDDGDDRLVGSDDGGDSDPNFSDTIYFGDVIDGGAGDDTIFGLGGADNIVASLGADWVDGGTGSDRIRGGDGNDYLYAGFGTGDVIDGELGDDVVYGSHDGNDTLSGGPGQDQLYGQGGNDLIVGNDDDDHLDGGTGTDNIQGGPGHDTLFGGGGVDDLLDGGIGNDVLHGSDDGADTMFGGPGRDTLFGHGGNDTMSGGDDDDRLEGASGDDAMSGNGGADLLIGGADHDILYGHDVNPAGDDNAVDDLYGDFGTNRGESGSGRDRLSGHGGNDRLWGEGDDDFIDPGAGTNDSVNYGTGDGSVPTNFVPPAPTPPPIVQSAAPISHALVNLPDDSDSRGYWSDLAGSGRGDGLSQTHGIATESTIATDSAGVRYVAWADSRSGNFEIYVARHLPNVGWQELPTSTGHSASGGGISNTATSSRRPRIDIDGDGNPIVAWTEWNGNTRNIFLRKYDASANAGSGAWIELGGSASAGGISASGAADMSAIVSTVAGPVVAWIDATNGVGNVFVKRFSAGTWNVLGGVAFGGGTGVSQSTVSIPEFDLATDGAKVSIAWTQALAQGSEIYLREFNGTSWGALAGSASGQGLSNLASMSRTPTVAYHSGNLFVAWQTQLQERPAVVAKFHNGSVWQTAGSSSIIARPHRTSSQPMLVSRAGMLHIAWADQGRSIEGSPGDEIDTLQWNGQLFAPPLAAGSDVESFSIPSVESYDMILDHAGHIMVTWTAPGESSSQVYVRGQLGPIQTTTYHDVGAITVQQILDSVSLGVGHVIRISAPTPGFTVGPNDSGVTIIADTSAYVTGPIVLFGANDVVLQGITAQQLVTIDGGSRNAVINSRLLGGLRLIDGTDTLVIGNVVQCDGIELLGARGPIIEHNQISAADVGILFANTGNTNARVHNNIIQTTTGIRISNSSGGTIAENEIHSTAIGVEIIGAWDGVVRANAIHGAREGVRYGAGAALDGNRIYDNVTGIVTSVASTDTGLGFLPLPGDVTTRANDIFRNNVGIQLNSGAVVQQQRVFGNGAGVRGVGSVGGADFQRANQIERNGIGVDVTGTVRFNYIGFNTTGIVAQSHQEIAHNMVYRNAQLGIDVTGTVASRIVSNTIYAPTVDAIRVRGNSRESEFSNNQIWADAGYALHVSDDSQAGFWSDYNLWHAGPNGTLVHWSGFDFKDVLDWQADVATYDLHSRGRTTVNPNWSEPRFADMAINDFRTIQLAGRLRYSNPAIDAGDIRTDLGLDASTPANLLTNGSFVAGLTGWITNAGATTDSTNPTTFDATPYFRPGNVAAGFADQTVDLIAQGITVSQLDSGDYVAVFGGRVRSAAEPLPDRGRLIVRFLTAAGAVISERTADASNDPTRWERVGDRVAIPAGTRRIAFRFAAERDSGTSNDVLLDDAYLRVHSDTMAHDIGAAVDNLSTDIGMSSVPHVALRYPDLYVDWLRDQGRLIRWDSFGNTNEFPVRIDLYQDGPHGPALLSTIATSTPDDGEFSWSPATSGLDFGTHRLRVQIQLVGDDVVLDRSTETFSVPENTNAVFVNDRIASNDEYTSSPGSNRSTGRLATAPKPLPTTATRIYSLGPNQTLYVDNGDYRLFHPLLISNALKLGDDEGFTISGPTTTGRTASLIYGNPLTPTTPAIDLNDADFVTIANINIVGGQYGLHVHNGSDSVVARQVSVSNAALDGIRMEPTTNGSTLDQITSRANGGYGIYVNGPLNRLVDSETGFNGKTGIHLLNPGAVQFEGNYVHDNRGSGIFVQQFDPTPITIGHVDLTLGRGNAVRDNAGHGIQALGNVLVAGNTVSGHRTTLSSGISVGFSTAQHNVVWDNYDGIVGAAIARGNRIYKNANTGLYGAGNFQENVVFNNRIGLEVVGTTANISNNVIYSNSQTAVRLKNGTTSSLVNNTIYQPIGDAVALDPQVLGVQLRNNVVWVANGYGMSVPESSQSGFQSDYNLLYATGNGRVGQWQGADRGTLAAWQNATSADENSVAQDPLFVDADGADNVLGFNTTTSDGRDDDFHEQSRFGSWHGGALAPVIGSTGIGVVSGLPAMPTGNRTNDVNHSVIVDRGLAFDPFGKEIAPNGGFINLGAYGNTSQASFSPAQYVTVMRPDGGEVWPAGQSFTIRWRSHNTTGNVRLDVLDANNATVQSVSASTPNDGEHVWTIPTSLPPSNYKIQVTRLDAGATDDSSNLFFSVPAAVRTYYVNDAVVNATGDWTTAPGNDANDGLSPATPKASLRALLDAYDFGAGDTIRVDVGLYNTTTNILLAADDSGVLIEGYHDGAFPTREAVVNRGNTVTGSYGLQFVGADNVTLDHITVTGGEYGIVALNGADSDGIMISSSTIHGNRQAGIYIDATNDAPQVVGNHVFNHTAVGIQLRSANGATVRDNRVHDMTFGTGIEVTGGFGTTIPNLVSENESYNNTYNFIAISPSGNAPVTVDQNSAHGGRFYGVQANGSNVIISNNVVYENIGSSSAAGIQATGDATVSGNKVYDNVVGIEAGAAMVRNNRVFHNSEVGIHESFATIDGNIVYSNPVGIRTATGLVANNLVYANMVDGIRVHFGGNGSRIIGNTVYQPTSGNAVRIGGFGYQAANVSVQNNILLVGSGYAIQVDNASQIGFRSNYNAIVTTGTGKAGFWNDRDYQNLTDWALELGYDSNSQMADPQFADVDGTDDQLGYIGTTDFGLDDDFRVLPTSSTIDAGDPASQFTLEPASNGGRVNLGHTGNTSHATTSSAQTVQVLSPNGLERLEYGQVVPITWRTSGITSGLVSIDLVNGSTGATVASVAASTANDGSESWTIPANIAEGGYRLRVTSDQGIRPTGSSENSFLIVNAGQHYYVNDDSTVGDVFTTAIGNNANSGRTPNQPVSSLGALLAAYDLDPGDVVHIDTGTYIVSRNIVISSQDSGVRIEGPVVSMGAAPIAILNRANTASGSFAIEVSGADDVTLEHLTITGGEYGIVALSSSDSDRLSVSHARIHGNRRKAVFIGDSNDMAIIANNEVFNNLEGGIYIEYAADATAQNNLVYNNTAGYGIEYFGTAGAGQVRQNEVSGSIYGIAASAVGSVNIEQNNVHDNRDRGISAGAGTLVVRNTVSRTRAGFGDGSSAPVGIIGTHTTSVVRENVVFDNKRGIQSSDGSVIANRVYHNDVVGLQANFGARLQGNMVYSNGVGVATSSFTGQIVNNLIYDNPNDGIWLAGGAGAQITNNTIYQTATGDAIQVGGAHPEFFMSNFAVTGTLATNNILRVIQEYAFNISADSVLGFSSDFNNFVVSDNGKLGRWEDNDFIRQSDWFFELGFDQHSLTADPRLMDIDGPDNVLGYDLIHNMDRGTDDDFRVLPGSLTIDAGDPRTSYAGEVMPNGSRINVGHAGGTHMAQLSPVQVAQVLSPNGWEKFEVGQTVRIEWQTAGITPQAPVALVDAGGAGGTGWTADAYKVAGETFSFVEPVNLANLENAAPAATYQNGTYGGFGLNNRIAYQLPVSNGNYSIRLHFVEPTFNGPGQRLFDISLQGSRVASSFDIFAAAGGTRTGITRTYEVAVSGDQGIALEMVNPFGGYGAFVTGIEVFAPNPVGVGGASVNLEVSTSNGQVWNTIATNVPLDAYGRGKYDWAPTDESLGNSALVRATPTTVPTAADESDRPFLIANAGSDYYVNDASRDNDTFASSVGDNLASGKHPDRPMSSLSALLAAYDLDPGDVVHIDRGTYRLYRNVRLEVQDSGVRIEGPSFVATTLPPVAVLNRGNTKVGNYAIEVVGADDVTIDRMGITGATIGVYVAPGSQSDRLTLSDNDVFSNRMDLGGVPSYGIYVDQANDDVRIVGNRVHNQTSTTGNGVGIFVRGLRTRVLKNELFGQGSGIVVDFNRATQNADWITVAENTVHDHTIAGIDAQLNAVVSSNQVYSHQATSAVGIRGNQIILSDNTVWDNVTGIVADRSTTSHNRVFRNTVGISGQQFGRIENNHVYSNSIGISGSPSSGYFGEIVGNLVYGNTSQGIFVQRSFNPGLRIINNTVYQSVGDAIRIENSSEGTTLRNNVVAVDAGYAIYVTQNSQSGFVSDYNLLHQGSDPNAHIGFWGGATRDTLAEWRTATGQELQSVAADPNWVDLDGPDNVLGHTIAGAAYDGGIDDNFHLKGGSPAIDRGDSTVAPSRDRDGLLRRDDPGTANLGAPASLNYVDLGAYEFQGSSNDVSPPTIVSAVMEVVDIQHEPVYQIQVAFSEALETSDALSVGHYELRNAGPNNLFGDSDDVVLAVMPQYESSSARVTLGISSTGALLSGGVYRLTVRGTLHDLAGNVLDGDANGSPGGDFVRINGKPVLAEIVDRMISEHQTLSFTVVASDDGAVTYSLADGAPDGTAIDPVTGLFTWTPSEVQGPGSYAITVIAADASAFRLVDRKTFTVSVMEVNTAPVIGPIPDRSVVRGSRLSFVVEASDIDQPHNRWVYSLAMGAPAGAAIHPTSGQFSWLPEATQQPGKYSITILAGDNGNPSLFGTRTFQVTLYPIDPSLADFNHDGQLDGVDIDALINAAALQTDIPAFDLNGDARLDMRDRDMWLATAGAANLATGKSYLLGDANLDGAVDGTDYGIWNGNRFTAVAKWTRGDFDGDGQIDGSDFNIWNARRFTSVRAAALSARRIDQAFASAGP